MCRVKTDTGHADQRVCELGDGKKVSTGGSGHGSGVEIPFRKNTAQKPDASISIFKCGVNKRLQIVLRVVHVRKRRVVDAAKNALGLIERPASENPDVFKRDRVALLRHDAADLDISVGETEIVELGSAPKKKVLRKTSEVDHANRENRAALREVIDCSDRSVGVDLESFEAKKLLGEVTVDGEARCSNRTCAQRIAVDTGVGRHQAFRIALKNFDKGHE